MQKLCSTKTEHIKKCVSIDPTARLCSVRSSHLPFQMRQVGYVRSSLPILMHVGSKATPKK